MNKAPEDICGALNEPLHVSHIKTRQSYNGGPELAYIEAHHAIREANRIFGPLGWSRETLSLEQQCTTPYTSSGKEMVAVSYTARVRVTVQGIVREGIGYGDGQAQVSRAYSAHELAAKEAESDAMKRALMTFGDPFGLALYEKDKSKANVSNAPPRASKANSRELYAKLQAEIDATDDLDELQTKWAGMKSDIKTLPVDWEKQIIKRKDEVKQRLWDKRAAA